jgi:hypothetical protein
MRHFFGDAHCRGKCSTAFNAIQSMHSFSFSRALETSKNAVNTSKAGPQSGDTPMRLNGTAQANQTKAAREACHVLIEHAVAERRFISKDWG